MTSSDEIWRQIVAIVAVFGLLALAIRRLKQPKTRILGRDSWLSRWPSWSSAVTRVGAKTRRLKKIETLVLTAHHVVHIVAFDGRELLVATGPQGCTILPVDHEGPILVPTPQATTNHIEAGESPARASANSTTSDMQRLDLSNRACV
ncbi:MAG: hypothetical protein ABI824_18705 [Acidobacteriota bacterium]